MMPGDRKGFTLVELLVVVILAGFVLAATYQTLVANQRTFTVQAARIAGTHTLRAGADVLFSELREISAPDGDIIAMEADSLTVRAMRAFGLACDTATVAAPTLTVRRMGQRFSPGDSVVVLIDGNPAFQNDDVWHTLLVTAVDSTATCGTGALEAQLLTLDGLTDPDRVLPGAPLRAYERYTYALRDIDGVAFLTRREPGGAAQPMVGPLDSEVGEPLVFEFLDALGAPTTNTTAVSQIQVTLHTLSDVRNSRGDLVRDSLTMRINARN